MTADHLPGPTVPQAATAGAPSPVEDPPDATAAAAWTALEDVMDPELCLDVVSLGLIYDLRTEGENVVVEMTLTTPGCPVSESLPDEARAAIIEATGGRVGVDVRVVWDPPWNPEMMSDRAAGALGFGPR